MKNKLFVVAGGNQGEGLALVKELLSRKHNVCVLDKNIDKLSDIKSKRLMFFQVDVSDQDGLKKVYQQIENYQIAALFLNASDAVFCEAEKNDLKTIHKVLSGNAYGSILCCSVFYPLFAENAKIVFLNSRSASKKGIANQSLFCAAKWAMEGFSQSVKKACEKNNILVYNVYCGSMDTEFWTEKAVNMPVSKPDNLINVEELAKIIYNNVFLNMDAVVGDIIIERRKNG